MGWEGDGDGDSDGGNNCPEGGANSGAARTPALGEPVLTTLEGQDSPKSLAAGDLDGDGADDLVAGEIGTVLVYPSNAVGSPFFGAADWDRDGHIDLAVADGGDHQLEFMFGQSGTRDFTDYGAVPAADYDPAAIVPGDFDGDGVVDVGVFHDVSGSDGLFAVHPGT